MAKKFFYVCAGLLCLAVAFHLGAVTTHAQVESTIDGAAIQYVPGLPSGFRASGVVGRTFYLLDGNGSQYTYSDLIPGSERVIATDPAYGNVLLENGDLLKFTGTGWARIGNLLGGATAVRQSSWGEIKARYGEEAGK